MEEVNYVKIALKYFETFSNQDIHLLAEMFDSNCTLKDWEINAHGKEEVLKANKSIFDSVESINVNPLQIYCDKNTVIGDLHITINDKEELLVVDILKFTPEGKIKSINAYKG